MHFLREFFSLIIIDNLAFLCGRIVIYTSVSKVLVHQCWKCKCDTTHYIKVRILRPKCFATQIKKRVLMLLNGR